MATKIRWGVLGVAKIATGKVIPAMQRGARTEVVAIASRDAAKAKEAASKLGIPKSYGSYEQLLADPEIDAIYNPLPNHLHVAWSAKAAEAGKHVLCEKPLAPTTDEVRKLIKVRDRTGVKIGEAFMVRTHPQWLRALELVRSSEFGELRAMLGFFSYNNVDPRNIRNIKEFGGGAIFDIGVYPINTSRFIFGEEPKRVSSIIEWDPVMHVDRLTSVIMEFPRGQSIFTCSTQLVPYQRMQMFGTKQRIEIEIPFNAPNDRPCRMIVDSNDLDERARRVVELPVCDQYTIQGDAFARAIQEGGEVPVPLEDALKNLAVVEALFKAAKSRKWVNL